MRRTIRFLLEASIALVFAGLVLGAIVPLLHAYVEPLPRPVLQALVIVVLAACLVAATLRPGGSLRK